MIPTLLLVGLLLGRWWAVPLGGIGWAVALLFAGDLGVAEAPVAAALGGANVAVGVVGHRALGRAPRVARGLLRAL